MRAAIRFAMDSGQRWRPDEDTNSIKLSGDLQRVYSNCPRIALSVQPVPPFQSQGVEVCNELYGAKLLTEAYDKDEILDTLTDR